MCQNTRLLRPHGWQLQNARVHKKKRDNANHTASKPSQHLPIHQARTFNAISLSIQAEHASQRAPTTKNVALFFDFLVKGRRKKHATDRIRPPSTRDGPLDQPNERNKYGLQPRAIFLRAGPFKATFEHRADHRGANRCFEEGRVDAHSRMFGTLGRVSNPKQIAKHHSRSFVPGICSVCIRRVAQMSEHRGVQSQASMSS